MRQIIITQQEPGRAGEPKVEIVERKGLGHPDNIMDSIAEEVAVRLSKEYLERFGRVYHFNADKGLLVAGNTELSFGKGRVLEPARIIIGDRATLEVHGDTFPAAEIAENAVRHWLEENLPLFSEHVIIEPALSPGSPELVSLFEKQGVLGANDTSASVGYYPLTRLEQVVLETERALNSEEFKKEFPETGEDVKVMGVRRGTKKSLAIALAFKCSEVKSEKDYFRKKQEVAESLADRFSGEVDISINSLDKKGKGVRGTYLTVTGTSAESADSGEVGRGNKVNGLICLNRPSGSEAAAGKNPVSHTGKIYNVLSSVLAREVYEQVQPTGQVYVWMLSRIGRRIDQPLVSVNVTSAKSVDSGQVEEIINKKLDNIQEFCAELAQGKHKVC